MRGSLNQHGKQATPVPEGCLAHTILVPRALQSPVQDKAALEELAVYSWETKPTT